MRWADIRHQDRAVGLLRRTLAGGRLHHAYLFEGPDGVGKERTALALAARLLCQTPDLAPDADACGTCHACHMLAVGTHPDLLVLHRGLHKLHPSKAVQRRQGLFLTIDLVRHFLIEPIGFMPTQGRWRVFVVRDAERLNEDAQNALLKTLEEPPPHTRLVLLTCAPLRLLPTIRSRCQRVPFDRLPAAFVAGELERQLGLPNDAAAMLARLSDGRLGVAVTWARWGVLDELPAVAGLLAQLGPDGVPAFGEALVKRAEALTRQRLEVEEAAEPDEGADEPDEDAGRLPTDMLRESLRLLYSLVAALHRDALVTRHGRPQLRATPPQPAFDQRAAALPTDRLEAAVRAAAEAERMLDRNVAPQLVSEYLAVALLGDVPAA